ncbi:PAS domain-containing sensor histidine kinase [Nitriliruptor alkaliphilus]|uniref:sensor histidine kinase n=1 Tax=Nitriliruptor alkaliphilus TaxID=427918 RepID=UPI0006975916|nr:PAS domain-containing sensor histidine kinase [Nitriliruptor alkaliphilus]
MNRPRRVVRQLVIVTSVVGLLTGVLGLAVVRHLERDTLLTTAGDTSLVAAERTATVVDGRVDALLAQLGLFATREVLAQLDGTVTTELEVALRVTDQVDQLVVYDGSGVAVAAAASDRILRPADLDPRDPLPSDGPTQGRATVDLASDDAVLELSIPIESPPGTVVGLLVGRADVALVADEVTQQLSRGGRAALVTPEGTTFADRDRDRITERYVQPVEDLPAERPVATVDGPDGPTLLAGAPLRTLPAWVVVEQTEADIVGGAGATLGGPTGVLLAVVLAIVVAVIATGRRLLRPLGPLADGVGRLAAGERGVRVEEEGAGEVADLAQGFNRMAAALELRRRELEAAELGARLNEERLRLVVDGVVGYAIVLLDVLGDVRSWNAGAQRVTGYAEADVLGRRLTDLGAPGEPMTDPVVVATRTGRARTEGWFERPDRSRFWGELTVTALRRDDGAPSGYAAILQDVTERREARRALEAALHREQEAANELRLANELKDEFLAVAAHEIRTPLSAILGATQILAPGPFALDETETEEVRQMIWRHANDMHSIVERLLDFTQLQARRVRIATRPMQLREELERVAGSLGHELTEHDLVVDVEAVEVELDPGLVHHVVSNLLSNAAKFSPSGTRITLSGRASATEVIIAVSDEGAGIPAEDQERIFELFRQSEHTEASARGTGVGLTIVRRYLELVDGHIDVDSAPGQGATFTVRVPIGRAGSKDGHAGASGEVGTSVR